MNFKLLAWMVGPILGLIVLGWIVVGLLGPLFNALWWLLSVAVYLAVGIAVVGLAVWGWNKLRGTNSAGAR